MKKSKILIDGPVGDLELSVLTPNEPINYVMVICHPNPVQGGTMDNKVVTTVERSCNKLDIISIRFNFRGVGSSEGLHDNGLGEQQDLLSVLKWIKKEFPEKSLILSGFSFGAYVAYRVVNNQQVAGFVCIGAPVTMKHYSWDSLPVCPWIIIHGEEDEVISYEDIVIWHTNLVKKPKLISFEGTTHFFHGKLVLLQETITKFIKETVL